MLTIPPKRPVRFFNTTGPCNTWDHYMLPPADRLVGAQLDRYIKDKLYWVLHAPRQTGKTTFLQNWMREINSGNMEDPKIRKLMSTLVTGSVDLELANSEAFRICGDLGLVTMEKGVPSIANPLYKEVLARQMTFGAQAMIPEPEWQWEKPDGSLDMDALLKEFQKFWRKNSEVWEQKSDYTEAFPHLLLMAFLQRVLNGGGHIEREYAAGRGRMDLAVEYKKRIFIIEIKLIHSYDTPADIHDESLEQIRKYRDKIDTKASAYLVIFDRRDTAKGIPWDERIYWKDEAVSGGVITVVGC